MQKIKIPKLAYFRVQLNRKNAKIVALITAVTLLLGLGAGTYYFYDKAKSIENQRQALIAEVVELKNKQEHTQEELLAQQQGVAKSKEENNAKNAKIQELEAHIQELNKQIAGLNERVKALPSAGVRNNTSSAPRSSTSGANQGAASSSSSTIYDRIQVSDAFKPQVVRALDMIKANDGHSFGLLNAYVESINEMAGCGGYQVKKPIYVGSCGGTSPDYEIAAIIVHETTHVENVYVKKIYSVGTKAQELPAYQRQYDFAAKVGAPQSYLTFVQSKVDQYAALPN